MQPKGSCHSGAVSKAETSPEKPMPKEARVNEPTTTAEPPRGPQREPLSYDDIYRAAAGIMNARSGYGL